MENQSKAASGEVAGPATADGVEHLLEPIILPVHLGLVGRDEAVGDSEMERAAVSDGQLDGGDLASLSKLDSLPAEAFLERLGSGGGGGGGRGSDGEAGIRFREVDREEGGHWRLLLLPASFTEASYLCFGITVRSVTSSLICCLVVL